MKWLDRIFRISSHHKISQHKVPVKAPDVPAPADECDMHEKSDEKWDDQELDHAIALSLSEEDYISDNGKQALDGDEDLAKALLASLDGNKTSEVDDDEEFANALHASSKNSQVDDDEELARALQESLDLNETSTPSKPAPSPAPVHAISFGQRVCEGCKHEIGYGRYLSCMGAVWHPECFRCYDCENPISDHEFSMSGNNPYHKSCYKEKFHPKCDVCKQFIPTNAAGLIEYRAHPFWKQRYCPSHEYDTTPRCCSCERVEPRDAEYISLEDGRKLCLECLRSSIMDTGECQPLYHDIRDFYEGLNMKIEQQIPMLLVERQALNEAMEGEKDVSSLAAYTHSLAHHHMPETRGLCLSEEQTVNLIFRKPKIGAGNRLVEMATESQKLKRQCEVTAILVLYGLPRLLTGSILAHELMHAWLRLNGFQNLHPEVEEGICQVLAHMWLESEVMAGTSSSSSSSSKKPKAAKSEVEKKLGEFFLHQISMDTSPIYGEGFRAGHAAMVHYGLKRTLDHIKMTESFPV